MEEFLKDYSKLLDEKELHLSNETMATYLNLKEHLSNKEKQFVENHFQKCSVCKAKLEYIRQEDSEIDQYQKVQTFGFRIAQQWKYAAAAVVVMGILAIIYFTLSPTKEEIYTAEINEKDSTEVLQSDTLEASSESQKPGSSEIVEEDEKIFSTHGESFAANNVLESFINRNIRSDRKLEMLSPKIADTVSSPITFKWKTNSTMKDLKLILVNNKNAVVYEVAVAGNALTTDKKLDAGLYYWKLEADGNLEAVGKFFIVM